MNLTNGQRVVFLGDSITQAGVRQDGYVDLVREGLARHLGDQAVEIVGAGISGNRVPDCQERLARDVLEFDPDVVVIYIGTNDVWYSTRGQGTSPADFREGLSDLVTRCQSYGAKVVLCTPALIGEKSDGSNSLDGLLDEYSTYVRTVAQEFDVTLVDFRQEFLAHLRRINPTQKPHSVLTTDGIHLNALGNRYAADCLLRCFGVPIEIGGDRELRHIVLFKFGSGTDRQVIAQCESAFRELKEQIAEVHDIESGSNNSPEGLSKGFELGFVVTFKSENDRAVYLPHPQHKAFVERFQPCFEDVLVFDFWADVDVKS